MFSIVLTAGWLLAQSAPLAAPAAVPAAPAPAASPAATDAKPSEKDPVVCRYSMPLGSRLPQKTCALKSVLEQQQREARRMAEDVQTRSRGPYISTDH